MNKKLVYSVSLVAVGFLFSSLPVSASAFPEATNPNAGKLSPEALVEQMFAGKKDDQKVLEIDGGYLSGRMDEVDPITNQKITYNSNTDPKSITVAEAKKKELERAKLGKVTAGVKLPNPRLRFVTPPTKPKYLWAGEDYASGGWGGSGWQYAGFFFHNRSGRNDMIWKSVGDTARVGDRTDMNNLYYRGILGGVVINNNVSQRVYATDGSGGLSYFTYNPVVNSYYVVIGQ